MINTIYLWQEAQDLLVGKAVEGSSQTYTKKTGMNIGRKA